MILLSQLITIANDLWKMYRDLMTQSPVIGGAFTLYGMGVFTYVFKSVPSRILSYIKNQFTVGVAIHNNDELFYHTTKWLEKGEKVFRCKSFTAAMVSGRSKNSVLITIGNGNHLFFHNRWPFWLSRVEKEAQNTTERKESLFISTLGWYPNTCRNFLQEVIPQPNNEEDTTIYTFADSYWYNVTNKNKRRLDTVILTDENERKIREHIAQYVIDKEWYKGKHIPWRTGILLEGPPGTGKSTLSLALCGEFNCNLYIANLGTATDDKLGKMFKSLPPQSVMLIEDIDSYAIAQSRKKSKAQGLAKKTKPDVEDADAERMFGSLSGLLNAIDGITATEDRILVATTNHLERLDPALIRPGRFELILKIDNLNDETARKMFFKFFPTYKLPAGFRIRKDVSPVMFQTLAIGNKNNPEALYKFCDDDIFQEQARRATLIGEQSVQAT
jgi:mitochondrial chaperone BCS1